MAQVLPPLASWAAIAGLQEESDGGPEAPAVTRMEEAFLGEHGEGDCIDFAINLNGIEFEVSLNVDCEHKNGDKSKEEIRTCDTTLTPILNNKLDRRYVITENSHYFPDEHDETCQSSHITLLIRNQLLPASVIDTLDGKPLSEVLDSMPELDKIIGQRIIFSAVNLDDGHILIDTVAVEGPGEEIA